eukprot:6214750-Pleurochrysis_carterae.AAC.4
MRDHKDFFKNRHDFPPVCPVVCDPNGLNRPTAATSDTSHKGRRLLGALERSRSIIQDRPIISTCREESQRDTYSARRPGCSSSSVAQASDKRKPRVGVRGESQESSYSRCRLEYERSPSVNSRRARRYNARDSSSEATTKIRSPSRWIALPSHISSGTAAPPNGERRYRHWLPHGKIGRSGTPASDHARLNLVCASYSGPQRDLPGATVRGWAENDEKEILTTKVREQEQARPAGTGRTYGAILGRGRSQARSAMRATGNPKLGERSASTLRCQHELQPVKDPLVRCLVVGNIQNDLRLSLPFKANFFRAQRSAKASMIARDTCHAAFKYPKPFRAQTATSLDSVTARRQGTTGAVGKFAYNQIRADKRLAKHAKMGLVYLYPCKAIWQS